MSILDEFTSADLVKHLLVKAMKGGIDEKVIDTALRFVDHMDDLAIKNLKELEHTGLDFSMSHIRSLFKVANHCLQKVVNDFCTEGHLNIFDQIDEQYKGPQE